MELNITSKKNADETILTLVGKINTLTSQELGGALEQVQPDVKSLIIDLKDVDYVSSAGLRMLVTAQKKMAQQAGTLTIKNVQDEVMEVFDMTGLAGVFNITKD